MIAVQSAEVERARPVQGWLHGHRARPGLCRPRPHDRVLDRSARLRAHRFGRAVRGPPRPRRPATAPPAAAGRRAEVREEPHARRSLRARHRGRGGAPRDARRDASARWAPDRARHRVDPDARPRGQRGVRLQAVRRHEQPARARGAAGAPRVRPRPRAEARPDRAGAHRRDRGDGPRVPDADRV